MSRSTYGRDALDGYRVFILVSCILVTGFFTVIHTVHRLFYTPPILTANSRLLKNAILVVNWVILLIFLPFFITYTVISVEDDVPTCRALHLFALISFMVINFCFYRVLLFKSQAYDVMKEYQKTYFYVYWGVHILCPGLVASVAFIASIGKYEILTEDITGGNRLCVITGFYLLPFLSGSIPSFMAAFLDLGISLGCLTLLVLPLLKPGFTPKGNTGVLRNVIFSSIAILSTFSVLVIAAAIEFHDGYWTVGLVVEMGASDIVVNTLCINLCWPMNFYLKTIKRMYFSALGMDPGSMNSSHPKKSSASGPKSKDYIKRPRISTKESDYKPGPSQVSQNEPKIGEFSPKTRCRKMTGVPEISPKTSRKTTGVLERPSSGSVSKTKGSNTLGVYLQTRMTTPRDDDSDIENFKISTTPTTGSPIEV
ncbi:hypothetical protein AAMO2058_000288100 [Amorphochlora amoebiformis]